MDRSIPFQTLDQFGGLCTRMDASDLPKELSPLAENVEFFPGGVRTRRGLTKMDAGTFNQGAVVHATSFWASPPASGPTGVNIAFANGSNSSNWSGAAIVTPGPAGFPGWGTIWSCVGRPYTSSTFAYSNINGSTFKCASAALGDRLYMAFNDGNAGWHPALSFDGVNLFPVAPEGPGEGPQMVDSGTAASGTPIAVGTRYAICTFITRQGYETGASLLQNNAAHSFNFAGPITKKMKFQDIPLAPTTMFAATNQIVARRIYVTTAGGDQYAGPYYSILSKMQVNDNTSTTLDNVEFTEAELISGVSFDDENDNKADRIPCVWPASFATHRNRLIAVAPLNALTPANQLIDIPKYYYNVANTSFAGGFIGTRAAGWETPAAGGTFGETLLDIDGNSFHLPYKMTGDGASTIRGKMASRGAIYNYSSTETANNDDYGYWVVGRARATGPTSANYHVRFSETSVNARSILTTDKLSSQWTGFAVRLSDSTVNANVTPTIALVSTSGNLPNTLEVFIDEFYLVPHGEFFLRNSIFVSDAAGGGEQAFDGLLGKCTINQGVGQVRTPFTLRDNLFIPKDRSIWSIAENDSNAASWSVTPVSETTGTQSFLGSRAVDGYALLSTHDGAYLFSGGVPEPIATEIQTTWDGFDKKYTNVHQVAVDESGKRAYFLVWGTSDYELYVLDFFDGFANPIPSGSGRKWSKFTTYLADGTQVVISAVGRQYVAPGTIGDSRLHPMTFGNTRGTISPGSNGGFVQHLTANQFKDEEPSTGASVYSTIRSTYESGPFGQDIGRSLFQQALIRIGHPSTTASTSGGFHWYVKRPDGSTVTQQDGTCSNASLNEFESPIKHTGNQQDLYIRVGVQAGTTYATDTPGVAFTMNRLGVSSKPAPNAPIKGHN